MRKNILIAATAATLSFGAIAPVGLTLAAHAQTGATTSGTSIVDKIAGKFSLNKTDVQKVFDEDRTAHEAERTQAEKDKLAGLVTAGTLTQAQADKITAKRAEMKADMDANRTAIQSKTDTERKAAMDAKKAELDKWAADNGIDAKYLMPGDGMGRGRGPGGPGGNL
jgi:hypothetical protein